MLPGRLTRWKGGLDFIEAIARLGRRDVCCLLVGAEQRPGFRRELEAAIERHGLGAQFRIVEDCRDMPAAYMLADVVVSASTDPEGFGRVIVEAQAMGRPVIATDHGGARETVVPGSTGWLVPPGDAGGARRRDRPRRCGSTRRARGARRAARVAHIAAGFTREAMCARTHRRSTRSCCSPSRGDRACSTSGSPSRRELRLRCSDRRQGSRENPRHQARRARRFRAGDGAGGGDPRASSPTPRSRC